MKTKIIPGYNGIMPLDLTHIDPKYHREMIELHKKDIDNYKEEQEKLPPRLRYENSVKFIEVKLERYKYLEQLRKKT